ncbi:RHS repeat-associated protein OS=Castellaniella defragrans OX=75697 GN=HNR28_002189 PE=4 SV=1 [Castellaniella defragrans]
MSKTPVPHRFRTLVALLCGLAMLLPPCAAAPPPVAGVCRAPADRPPCGASASTPVTEPDLDPGLSNPIHLPTGEKYLREIDLPMPLDGSHPSFIRLYRSAQASESTLGPHWTHEYQVRLQAHAAGWRITATDGRRISFDARGISQEADAGRLQTGSPSDSPQWADATRRPAHVWIRRDGRRLDFDAQGRLQALHTPGQAPLQIERHTSGPLTGRIHHIRRQAGTLTLHYDTTGPDLRLKALETPLGTFHYTYSPAPGAATTEGPRLLTEVRRPDGMRRHYHYEPERQSGNPQAITGVTLAGAEGRTWRARTWFWDRTGRVIRAEPGIAGHTANMLELAYDLPGDSPATRVTRVRSPSGSADFAHRTHQGRTRIVGVSTQACPDCPRTDAPIERDASGRLTAIGALRIQRSPNGAIQRLRHAQGGWPGLTLEYDPAGRRTAWTSRLTGTTRALFDAPGRLQGLRHANGDSLDIGRDAAGRPTLLHYASAGQQALTVRLQWHGDHLRRLSHPAEAETREYDAQGRLSARTIQRPHASGTVHYHERFSYDAAGRLLRHDLPEGGALRYDWGAGTRLDALTWESADGLRHPVITRVPGRPGYRYGNGLHLQTRTTGQAHTLLLSDGPSPIWGEQRLADAQGRILGLHQALFTAGRLAATQHDYAYDTQNRLAGLREASDDGPTATRWLAWDDDGRLAARRTGPQGPLEPPPPIPRDASGLPRSVGDRSLHYQAQRLLARVSPAHGEPIHYTHNAQGHTIRRRQGARETERYYLDNRLVARWDRPAASATGSQDIASPTTFGVTQRYLYAHEVPVGLLQTDARGHTRLYAVHADLLGRPVLVTDDQRAVRWSAAYNAFGRAQTQGDLDLPLRAPGQDEDAATGWHDNVFRTYLPATGHYLEPDPLGPAPTLQALGYAAQQPMRHVDPLGLILLAFDGTRYGRANEGNVWKLAQAYDDGPTYYRAGPGNNQFLDWDALTAASSGQILRNQWQSLLGALQRAQGSEAPIPIDLLGFSRGAALARDFANRIAQQTRNGWFSYDDPLLGTIGLCVNLRFLGLFDTVAQFGLLGASNAGYDLTISGAWQWVAHAVALHEFRTLFPLVSAAQGTPGNVGEAPFIGAHADIGGGLALDDEGDATPRGDLSDVALNWMRWQALAALVPLRPLSEEDQRVTHPLLHDERIPAERLLDGDRTVQDATTRTLGPQSADPRIGAQQRAALDTFIQRFSSWQINSGNVVGSVDMRGYDAWLQTQMGLPTLRTNG